MTSDFAPGWVTKGWSRINDVWYELGSIPQVITDSPDIPPELTIHQIADKLNELEAQIKKE
jgi:hypothetical protein